MLARALLTSFRIECGQRPCQRPYPLRASAHWSRQAFGNVWLACRGPCDLALRAAIPTRPRIAQTQPERRESANTHSPTD